MRAAAGWLAAAIARSGDSDISHSIPCAPGDFSRRCLLAGQQPPGAAAAAAAAPARLILSSRPRPRMPNEPDGPCQPRPGHSLAANQAGTCFLAASQSPFPSCSPAQSSPSYRYGLMPAIYRVATLRSQALSRRRPAWLVSLLRPHPVAGTVHKDTELPPLLFLPVPLVLVPSPWRERSEAPVRRKRGGGRISHTHCRLACCITHGELSKIHTPYVKPKIRCCPRPEQSRRDRWYRAAIRKQCSVLHTPYSVHT